MSEIKPDVPPEFVDVYPTEGRRVRIETGELLPFGNVLRGVTRTTFLLRLKDAGDVTLKAHEPEPPAELQPPAAPVGDPSAGAPPAGELPPGGSPSPAPDAGAGKPRKS